jgi:hypothetical protein
LVGHSGRGHNRVLAESSDYHIEIKEGQSPFPLINREKASDANSNIMSRLGVEDSHVYNNIDRYGNTTAAAIPIALSEALEENRVHHGDLVMLVSFGSGYTWAGALLRWLDSGSGN